MQTYSMWQVWLAKVKVKMLALFQIYAQTITLLCSKIELLKTILNTVVNSLKSHLQVDLNRNILINGCIW